MEASIIINDVVCVGGRKSFDDWGLVAKFYRDFHDRLGFCRNFLSCCKKCGRMAGVLQNKNLLYNTDFKKFKI
jgi:hypothetical protein